MATLVPHSADLERVGLETVAARPPRPTGGPGGLLVEEVAQRLSRDPARRRAASQVTGSRDGCCATSSTNYPDATSSTNGCTTSSTHRLRLGGLVVEEGAQRLSRDLLTPRVTPQRRERSSVATLVPHSAGLETVSHERVGLETVAERPPRPAARPRRPTGGCAWAGCWSRKARSACLETRRGERPPLRSPGLETVAAQPPRPTTAARPPRPTSPAQPPRPTTPAQPPRPTGCATSSTNYPARPPRPTTPARPPRPTTPAQPPRPHRLRDVLDHPQRR